MVKKIVSLLLAGIMTVSLAACGGATDSKNNSTEKTSGNGEVNELTLAWSGTGQDKEKFDALVEKYTEETGVKINTIFIPGTWSEYFTKIQSMIGAGEEVDVAFVAIEGFHMMCDMGIAKPLNPYIDENKAEVDTVMGDLAPELADALTLEDGNMYAFPTEWNNICIHYNKTMFEDAGLSAPADNWTKDDFLAACQALTKEVDGVKQYGFAVPQYYFMIEGWLRNNGSSIVSDDLKTAQINSPENVEVIQFLQDLIYKYEVAPIPEPNVDPIQQLIDGKVAMGSYGRWPTLSYQANDFKDAAVTYVPKFKTQQTIFGTGGVAVTSDEKYDEAAKFALWCAQDTFVEGYLTAGGIPTRKTLADKLVGQEYDPENYELFYESVNGAVPIGAPAAYAEIDTIVMNALSEIYVNHADVKATLDAAQAQMEAAMQ